LKFALNPEEEEKEEEEEGTPSLGPVSHQVDGLGAITMSDAGTP